MSKIDSRLRIIQQQSRVEAQLYIDDKRFGFEEAVGHPVAPPEKVVRVLLSFDGEVEELVEAGFVPEVVAGDVAGGSIPVERLHDVGGLANVRVLESSRVLTEELDISRIECRVDVLQTGDNPLTGKGVIIGIIDSGIDFSHPSFLNADGTSRVLWIWDQSMTPQSGEAAPPWSLISSVSSTRVRGVEYSQAQINATLQSQNPAQPVRHMDGSRSGHGTHVAGIAAGNGRKRSAGDPDDKYVGIAPGADLIVVRNIAGTDALGDSIDTLAAVRYIFSRAAEINRPVVINQSQGDNLGPHDGTALLERGISNLLTTTGRSYVKSVGNARRTTGSIHASARVNEAELSTVEFVVPEGVVDKQTIDVWYGPQDRVDVRVLSPSGEESDWVVPNPTPDTPVTEFSFPSGNHMVVASLVDAPQNHDNNIMVVLSRGSGNTIEAGSWLLQFKGTAVQDGRLHAWIERTRRGQPHFVGTQANNDLTVTVPGTAHNVITVGSYVTFRHRSDTPSLGDLSTFSGRGPTRDDRIVPTVCAPGEWIKSARSKSVAGSGGYHHSRGTSMAAPHVAGIVALMFEKAPSIAQADIIDRLARSATFEEEMGSKPNNKWGNGRADAKSAVDLPTDPST